ncbi:MAG TPA: hypothetical protein VH325_07195 [Bryobacteraceae bacterium]|nr:hypothetical protein [Bryobacteraceae bacterium]
MAVRNLLQAMTCLILCGAALACAETSSRPAPIASPTETTVVDGGLGNAPAIALPTVESAPTSNSAAEFAHTGAQSIAARQTNHVTSEIWKMSPGSIFGSAKQDGNPPGNNKLSLKGLLFHKVTVTKTESAQ